MGSERLGAKAWQIGTAHWCRPHVQRGGFARMNVFSQSRIVLPLASLMTVFALSAHAEEPNQPHRGPPPGAGKPPVQAARPMGPHPGGPAPHVARGPIPSHSFGGHPYRGHLAWEGGRWRHEMHNGRMGW